MGFFKSNLKRLIVSLYGEQGLLKKNGLPEDYVINHISATFVETVSWWLSRKRKECPEEVTEYFLTLVRPLIEEQEVK